MKQACMIFFLIFTIKCSAQKDGYIWYFGDHAGLDFNFAPPKILNYGAMSTIEGCGTISNTKTGALLFYTDGVTVWDNTHTPMPSSLITPLAGHASSTQSGVIVPKPGDTNIFYIFTAPAIVGGLGTTPAMCYSIVDLKLNGGKGDLISINNPILDSATEKIAVIGACNGKAFWIVGHQWGTDSFFAFKLTANGLASPVKTAIGIIHQDMGNTTHAVAIGQMKFSTNAKKIGLVTHENSNKVQLFDFDEITGILSNAFIDNFGSNDALYGCSFSPDNSKFYISNVAFTNKAGLYQYDINAGNNNAILASKVLIQYSTTFGSLQNAPNGKIYITNTSNVLNVINQPNQKGLLCDYQSFGLDLGVGFAHTGLPSIVESFVTPQFVPPNDTSICAGDTFIYSLLVAQNIAVYPQNSSIVLNNTILFYPKTYTQYSIVFLNRCGNNDTTYFSMGIFPKPNAQFTIQDITNPFENNSIVLNNNSTGNLYNNWYQNNVLFNTGINDTLYDIALGKHCFLLKIKNQYSCTDTFTNCITLFEPIESALFVPNAFTPNDDGINDELNIKAKNLKLNYMKIYNRFGNQVFECSDILKSWDGYYVGQKCDAGVYYYLLQYVDSNSKTKLLKGDISLLN
jgi:gliding motility-associated-like protein